MIKIIPSEAFVWVDLETLGLNPSMDPIIEIGIAVTDGNLVSQAEFSAVSWSDYAGRALKSLRTAADKGDRDAQFVVETHTKNGLLDEAQTWGSSLQDVEFAAINWLRQWFPIGDQVNMNNRPALCGSSVHFDRAFMTEQMPILAECFHYRNIDVSTLMQLCKRWNPALESKKKIDVQEIGAHRVLPDLADSIAYLRWYRDNFLFIPGGMFD